MHSYGHLPFRGKVVLLLQLHLGNSICCLLSSFLLLLSVSSTKKDIDKWITKAWTAIGHIEIRPDRKNETQFLPSSSHVDTAVWMHHLDANKTAGEEARRQLHKNVTNNIKQVLAATPHKTPTIQSGISMLVAQHDDDDDDDWAYN